MVVTHTVPKDVIYFPIVYTGASSFSLRNNISKLIREFYPQVAIRVIFKSTNTIGKMYKFKDKIPIDLQSSLVYKYSCDSCKASYIGKTKRHLRSRIAEHLGRSARTNARISNPPFSAIREHSLTYDHRISIENFSVLAKSSWDQDLAIMESLFTHTERPTIGTHESSSQLLCF